MLGVTLGVTILPSRTAEAQQPATQARVALSCGVEAVDRRTLAESSRWEGNGGKEASMAARDSGGVEELRAGGLGILSAEPEVSKPKLLRAVEALGASGKEVEEGAESTGEGFKAEGCRERVMEIRRPSNSRES